MSRLLVAERMGCVFGSRGLFGRGRPVHAVSDVSIVIDRGEAVGLVGESGSGKTTIGRMVVGLTAPTSGRIMVDGIDPHRARGVDLQRLRQRMQLVFQDPNSSLDPRRTVGAQIADGLAIHRMADADGRRDRVAGLLEMVGMAAGHAARFPHEFSGGQRQRIGIARALATAPDFLVLDEPVSALDVSVQAQVLTLLADLRSRLNLGLLFISHDLPVVRSLCDRVIVLYLGRVMEEGPIAAVFGQPSHPYTRALLSAAPSLKVADRKTKILLEGEPPSPADPPSGCVFRPRCPCAIAMCAEVVPALRNVGAAHRVACIRDDIRVADSSNHIVNAS